jgi:sporadic carbohydrate cluster 2OG-Fe(II) oxygenase
MNIVENIINGPGYVIMPIEDMDTFSQLRKLFIEKMGFETNENDIDILRKKMANMTRNQINQSMVNLLSFNEASEMMIRSCKGIVENLSGKEILIQRRAATIFNLPGKDQRRQWPHYELMSGISPFTFVLWAPFHDLEDEGGVYYIDQLKSLDLIKLEHSQGLVNGPTILSMMHNQKPAKLKYGEVIVFNPFILHGNVDFQSDLARIACSVRFQSIKKPLLQKNTDFFKFYNLN